MNFALRVYEKVKSYLGNELYYLLQSKAHHLGSSFSSVLENELYIDMSSIYRDPSEILSSLRMKDYINSDEYDLFDHLDENWNYIDLNSSRKEIADFIESDGQQQPYDWAIPNAYELPLFAWHFAKQINLPIESAVSAHRLDLHYDLAKQALDLNISMENAKLAYDNSLPLNQVNEALSYNLELEDAASAFEEELSFALAKEAVEIGLSIPNAKSAVEADLLLKDAKEAVELNIDFSTAKSALDASLPLARVKESEIQHLSFVQAGEAHSIGLHFSYARQALDLNANNAREVFSD